MCDKQPQQENALISAQNHGTILVMVAWALACILALCTVARIIARYRSQRLRHLHSLDNAVVVVASLCALGSTVVISTAVDSGLGKRRCLLSSADMEHIQLKLFVSTILFVSALSISKCSVLLFLYHLAESTLSRVGVVTTGVLVLLWTIAVLAAMVFQCEMPTPWDIWTAKCVPLVPFWMAATFIDIVVDLALLICSAYSVLNMRISHRRKAFATSLLSLRLIVIAASVIRLFYVQPFFDRTSDPTFTSIPYTITSQAQATLAVLLSCSLALPPFVSLSHTFAPSHQQRKSRHSKHWSGTTIGGTPYESYSSPIIKEPLPSIQASMSTPTSPTASRNSLRRNSSTNDILLPEIPMCTKTVPKRPPPPREDQRPDLSIFIRRTDLRQPPTVLERLGSLKKKGRNGGMV